MRLLKIIVIGILFILPHLSFAQGVVYVKGYFRKDGTYVPPHFRTKPDNNPYNNFSFPGNYNPYTGKIASGNPETYLKNYYSKKYKSKSFISTDINTQIPSLYNLNGYENNLDNLLEQYNQQYENYQKQYENLLKDCLNQSNDLNNDYQFDYEDLLNQ